MKASKTIWFTEVPPKDSNGAIVKEAIFDRRVKKISIGDEIDEKKIGEQSVKRLKASKAIVKELPLEQQMKVAQEKAEKASEERKAADAEKAREASTNPKPAAAL